jgi:hypothetical protein
MDGWPVLVDCPIGFGAGAGTFGDTDKGPTLFTHPTDFVGVSGFIVLPFEKR